MLGPFLNGLKNVFKVVICVHIIIFEGCQNALKNHSIISIQRILGEHKLQLCFYLKNVIGFPKPWFPVWKPWSRFLPVPGPTCIEAKCMIEVTVAQRLRSRCEIRRKSFTLQISFSLLRILPQEWNTLGKNWVKMLMLTLLSGRREMEYRALAQNIDSKLVITNGGPHSPVPS